MKLVTAAQMQALDRRTIEEGQATGLTLMTRAGTGVVTAMEHVYGPVRGKRVTIFCGKGNNGGDGFVVARRLRQRGARPHVFLLAKPTELKGDARTVYRRWVAAAGQPSVTAHPGLHAINTALSSTDFIIDALLGTGLSASVAEPYSTAIGRINACSAERPVPVIAVDLPSGIHADTGAVMGQAVSASLTVTFGLPKLGLFLGAGIDHAGRVEVVDIGIPSAFAAELDSRISLVLRDDVAPLIPARPLSAHKGTYGHAAIIAGSIGKTGAAAMAAKAALRVGAGLVTVATPASANSVLEAKLLEAMTIPMPETEAHTLSSSGFDRLAAFADERSAVAIGPGLTVHPDTAALVRRLFSVLDKPLVIDADGLNALQGHTSVLKDCKSLPVLTPHPGEMARLDESATTQSVNADRLGTAMRFAQQHRCVLVLKGARTIVANPDSAAAICSTGNPGMATAGTGDVLTGMIVGLLAQRLTPWNAACSGTYLHGLAGDLAAVQLGQAGMTAGDVIDRIPHAIQHTIRRGP